MKTKYRALATTKILAVALGATAGCAPAVDAPAATSEPERGEVVTVVVPVQSSAAPQARPSPEDDPALLALSNELEQVGRDDAMKRIDHFRPLCDKDGYPLVGNLARKGPIYGPTAFCAEVHTRAASR
jgi:hypothetical protein